MAGNTLHNKFNRSDYFKHQQNNPSVEPEKKVCDESSNPTMETEPTNNPSNQEDQVKAKFLEVEQATQNALQLVDDVVLKNGINRLNELPPLQTDVKYDTKEVYLFKINKIVYEKDEYATDKFASVISAMTFADVTIFLVLDGHGDDTDFYIGLKEHDENRSSVNLAEALRSSLIGQFPGIGMEDMHVLLDNGSGRRKEDNLLDRIAQAETVSSCTSVPSLKDKNGKYTNANFIQGVEKLAMAMRGKTYTAIILAENLNSGEIKNIRYGYEQIYEQLSVKATQQISYSTNESLSNALSRTKGTSESHSTSKSKGINSSDTLGSSGNQEDFKGKVGKMSGSLLTAGAVLAGTGFGAPLGGILVAAGLAGSAIGFDGKQQGANKSHTNGINESESESHSISESFSETDGRTSTIGETKGFTLTRQDKHIQEILKRIDKQLERIAECESTGLWASGAYFLSYKNDRATAETGATIYRSIIQGDMSGVEASAINTWHSESKTYKDVIKPISCFCHPAFVYNSQMPGSEVYLFPTAMTSSKELALMIGLPRKSVPGIIIREQATFGNKVVAERKDEDCFPLGYVTNLDRISKDNKVELSINSLASHTFVTGSTGCGKSNTVYLLVDSLVKAGRKFMIIEPAKGEYKNVFGHREDVRVFGTNPNLMDMLKINPFAFPEGIHIEEHIDRLIDIFNACWPMYAAMPAVLKKSITNAYKSCGWDLMKSESLLDIYPTFQDVIRELNTYINTSEYSSDSKGDYKGALGTRLESLTNGIVGQIFVEDLYQDQRRSSEELFNGNVIVDLSRVGSMETKALIMGILVMRLNEFRMSEGIGMNLPLRHVTVLEEAHNLLKATSTSQSQEGSNVLGKSVEMISSSIAEMRTYGEGFIIADQSPSMLDRSAISNTNTKIIMTLPNKDDREMAGNSTSLTEPQKTELSRLKTGVAVVFQKGWEEAVLCKINRFEGKEETYKRGVDDNESVNDIPSSFLELTSLIYTDEEDGDTDALLAALETDHTLTGKQRYDLQVRIYEIREAWRISEEEGTVSTEPEDIHDVAAVLFSLCVGVEAFESVSSSSADMEAFNEGVRGIIAGCKNAKEIDDEVALEMYVRGCSLLNSTEFFESWYSRYNGIQEELDNEE
ncbi:MAG: ATP-binding protein [bacterium]|nr:ATP-binding protein [Candidatus Limimorpha caballi]